MGNEHPDQADHFLHGTVRVIKKCAFLMHSEFVSVCSSGCDRFLADVGNAILLDGKFQAVPMHRRAFWQAVLQNYPDAIALDNLNRRTWAAAIEAPNIDDLEWGYLLFQWLGLQPEHSYVAVHLEWQIRNVRRDHRHPLLQVTVLCWLFPETCLLFRVAQRSHSEQADTEKCRILKKPSARTAHTTSP